MAARLCEAGRRDGVRGGRHAWSGTGVLRRRRRREEEAGRTRAVGLRKGGRAEGFARGQSHFLKRKNQIVRPEQRSIRPMAKK